MKYVFLAAILLSTSSTVFAVTPQEQIQLEQKQLLERTNHELKVNPPSPTSKEKAEARAEINRSLKKKDVAEDLAIIKRILGDRKFALITSGEMPDMAQVADKDGKMILRGVLKKVAVHCVARNGKDLTQNDVIIFVEHPDCVHVDEVKDPASVSVR